MSVLLNIPRSTTWKTLENSRNIAAVAALSPGLASASSELRQMTLRVLLARKEPEARRAIVLNWEYLVEDDQELLRPKAQQFVDVVKDILQTGALAEKRMALAAVAALDLSDAMDVLLDIAVDPKHALCQKATDCLMEMCGRWGHKARTGKDSPMVRGKMLERLNNKLVLFHEHKNTKLIDAWLCLAHWDDSLQRGLISDPRQDAYRAVMTRLRECQHPAVLQLLGGYLSRSTAPKSVIGILTERPEAALAIEISKLLDKHSLPTALRRLQQLPPLQCLKGIEAEMPSVGIDIERRIWLMVAASTDDTAQVLRGAVKLSKVGTKEARQTAAEMLRGCRRPDLETLVPAIQAASVEMIDHDDHLGSLVLQVASWLKSPSLVLKQAARDFLKEFTVDRLLEQVRHWPTQMCSAMAGLVAQVELDIAEHLKRELQSPAPKRRLAALQATQLLQCADAVSKALMPLLNDPRLDVRVRTIDLLGALGHESLEQLIPELLHDASTDIQDAAHRATRRMKRQKAKQAKEN